MSMNVNIISSTLDKGGAGIAALRLKNALDNVPGLQTHTIVSRENKHKGNSESYIPKIERSATWRLIFTEYIKKNRSKLSNTFFDISLHIEATNIKKGITVQNGIINIHWVANFLSIKNIGELGNLNIPMIWTLHDEGPYTGGCHYTAGCTKFIEECYSCPQLKVDDHYIPHNVLKYKKLVFPENLHIVTPSEWLSKRAALSTLFKNNKITTIPNGIDTEIFKPIKKADAKKMLNISPNTFVLAFGAVNVNSSRKGYQHLINVMNRLNNDTVFNKVIKKNKIMLLTFGKFNKNNIPIDMETCNLGLVDDESQISKIFASADLFIMPSLEDNLPNTMLESMASGTPVLSFRIGGIPDVIKHNHNGLLVKPFDTTQMATEIIDYFNDKKKQQRLGKAAIDTIRSNYTLAHQAKRYKALFSKLTEENKLKEKGQSCDSIQREIPSIPRELNSLYLKVRKKVPLLVKIKHKIKYHESISKDRFKIYKLLDIIFQYCRKVYRQFI
ncbi:MAG: glycosyltransferase [Leptospirales bacterium]